MGPHYVWWVLPDGAQDRAQGQETLPLKDRRRSTQPHPTHTHLSTRVLSSWPSGYTGVLGAPVVSGKPTVKSWPRAESPWQPQEGQGVLPTPLRTARNSSAQSTITQAPQTSWGVAEQAQSPVHPQTRKGPGERRSQVHMAGRSVSWLPTPPSAVPPHQTHSHHRGSNPSA